MARITVNDCIDNVENRFQLIQVATKRARQLMNGYAPLVDPKKNKPAVIALREIAAGKINETILNKINADAKEQLAETSTLDIEQAKNIMESEKSF